MDWNNREQVLKAVQQNGSYLGLASNRLKDDYDIVLVAVKKSYLALLSASERLRDNEDIVLEAVKNTGYALKYASHRLQDNYNIVLEAVKENGNALEYASERLKDSEDIVIEAVKRNPYALQLASTRLKYDKNFIINLARNSMVYKYLPNNMKQDKDIYNAYVSSLSPNENNVSYHANQKYHILKGKFLSIISQINDLKSKKNNQNKEQINNHIGKLKSELSKLKYYNEVNNIASEKEINKLLLLTGDDKFLVREDIWGYGSGQNFTHSDEKVIIIEWDKSILQRFANDSIMVKFFNINPRFSHFINLFAPIGFALVYEKDKSTWVINEIQSDLIAELQQIKKSNDNKKSITQEELLVQLRANGQEGLYDKIISNSEYLSIFLNHPEYIRDLHGAGSMDSIVNHIKNNKLDKDHLYLSPMEYRHVYSQIGYLLDNWYKIVFHAVWLKAREAGIQHLYMNTSETVHGNLSESSKKIHYESYPKELGFQKQKANLRDKDETFWYRKASKLPIYNQDL